MRFNIIVISILIILNSCKSSDSENVNELAQNNASESVESTSQMEFVLTLMQLPNWRYDLFSEDDLEKYYEAVVDFRTFTHDERIEIFRAFQNKMLSSGDDDFVRRLYILIRIHFVVEDLEPEPFAGYTGRTQNDLNNLWPLVFENNEFIMVAKYEGMQGMPYYPLVEYVHYLERTKERTLKAKSKGGSTPKRAINR